MIQFIVPPNEKISLADITTRGEDVLGELDRDALEIEFDTLRKEFIEWQYKWYAEGNRKLLIVLQALDAGGKDGTIRNIFKGVNPQGVEVTSFKAPSAEELAHDYLWRIHQNVPQKGMIGIFNRSHYEDVLVVRVDNFAPPEVWQKRYTQINQFEQMLVENDTTILKFYLHISKKEQKERLQKRINDPEKSWKFDLDDLRKRGQWDEYWAAFEDVFEKCSTESSPWYVIPADQKWVRDWIIMKILVEKIRELDPKYPTPKEDLTGIIIE